jgi:hypothetical protein
VRITRETLIELARHETEQRAAIGDVISGYIIGSVARDEPLLGGTADIDLVLIHQGHPPKTREIVRLSEDVHLDIAHHSRDLYSKPRELRVHPWLGPAMCEPIFLYDPQHFFEWAQAGARGRFYRPDHVYARALAFLKMSRQSASVLKLSDRWIKTYTRAMLEAANAVACLTGFPVAGRRMVLNLEQAVTDLDHPEVSEGFLRLLGVDVIQPNDTSEWLSAWTRIFDQASVLNSEPELAPCRRSYYLSGFQALLEAGRPDAIIWTLLTTWERSVHSLQSAEQAEMFLPLWESTLERLRLTSARSDARNEELERYSDRVEEIVELWAERNGA